MLAAPGLQYSLRNKIKKLLSLDGQSTVAVTAAHLVEFDSVHGRWRTTFEVEGERAISICAGQARPCFLCSRRRRVAPQSIALIYPELKGTLNGHAVRAPVLNASLTDCVFELNRATTEAEVNELFAAAARGRLEGVLGYESTRRCGHREAARGDSLGLSISLVPEVHWSEAHFLGCAFIS